MNLIPGKKIIASGQVRLYDYQWYIGITRYILTFTTGIVDLYNTPQTLLVYPNPLKEMETLTYDLEESEPVTISLIDLSGREIYTFMDKVLRVAGSHSELLQIPQGLTPGHYIIEIFTPHGSLGIDVIGK